MFDGELFGGDIGGDMGLTANADKGLGEIAGRENVPDKNPSADAETEKELTASAAEKVKPEDGERNENEKSADLDELDWDKMGRAFDPDDIDLDTLFRGFARMMNDGRAENGDISYEAELIESDPLTAVEEIDLSENPWHIREYLAAYERAFENGADGYDISDGMREEICEKLYESFDRCLETMETEEWKLQQAERDAAEPNNVMLSSTDPTKDWAGWAREEFEAFKDSMIKKEMNGFFNL